MLVKLLPPFVVLLVAFSLPWQHHASSPAEAPAPVPATTIDVVYAAPVAPLGMPSDAVGTTPPLLTTLPFIAQTPTPEEVRVEPPSPPKHVVPTAVPDRAWALLSTLPPEQIATMSLIAWCESRFVDDVVGEGRYVGWFQISPDWLGDTEVIVAVGRQPVEALRIPEINVRVAAVLAARHPDFRDWPVTRFGC